MSDQRLLDTDANVHGFHINLMRQAEGWRKLQLADQLHKSLMTFTLAGLRARYPDASQGELRRRLADILLGVALAERAYGPFANRR
ncbi:MAG TPA: hypothetical protein VLK65_04590 [Vicinamibacteria bacterium]|nr:hypothetical protein [Vicinamibacteria bacterium]